MMLTELRSIARAVQDTSECFQQLDKKYEVLYHEIVCPWPLR